MESKNVALTDIINDLIQVNKGRIKGYNSAMVAGRGIFEDLKAFFNKMIVQAEEHINNLELKMAHLGGSSGGESPVSEKITTAFRRVICRKPTEREDKILQDYYNEQLQLFQQKKLNAAVTLKAGEYPMNEKLDVNQSAALMKVINAIYNMEEAIVK